MTDRGELGAYVARGIRARRVWLGLGQADVARQLGCSGQTVSAMERGIRRITMDDLPGLCRALDTTLSDLLHGADPDLLKTVGLAPQPPPRPTRAATTNPRPRTQQPV